MTEDKIQLSIKLTDEQKDGYPVSSESLWFLKEGDYYRLINIPFFVDGVSIEDIVSLKPVPGSQFSFQKVISRSGNSTIWVTLNDYEKGKEALKKIHGLGCGYEGGVLHGYFAINVPKSLNIKRVYLILDDAESKGVLMCDYPNVVHT